MPALLDAPVALTPEHLLDELAGRGVAVSLHGTDLRFSGPTSALPAEMKTAIRDQATDLISALTGFAPLSESIIRDLARKHTSAEIEARIDHSRLTAAQLPDAPVYAKAVLNWLQIMAAKERGTVLDDREPSEHDDDEPWPGDVDGMWSSSRVS